MNLEEDAMLVAIGQMSMDEARDKWADDWNRFIQALTRWKSIHQLLRLGQLLKTQRQLTDNKEILELQKINYQKILTQLDMAIDDMENNSAIFYYESDKLLRRYPTDEYGEPLGVEFLTQKLGKNQKLKYDYKTDVYIWSFHSRLDKELDEAVATLEWFEDALQYNRIEKRKINKQLAETEKNLNRAQDQYDITKPYAMGLLVADIFYSLAAALQGDIY